MPWGELDPCLSESTRHTGHQSHNESRDLDMEKTNEEQRRANL